MLIILTDRFDRLTSESELFRYAGLAPVISHSGSSVKGRLRISKMGNQKLRNYYLCAVLILDSTTKRVGNFMSV